MCEFIQKFIADIYLSKPRIWIQSHFEGAFAFEKSQEESSRWQFPRTHTYTNSDESNQMNDEKFWKNSLPMDHLYGGVGI